MDFLVADEEIGRGVGDGGVAVVAVVVGVGVAAVVAAAVAAVVVGGAAAVGGERRDCIEAGWCGGTKGGIVEVVGVRVGDPTFEIAEDNRMGTFVDRGRDRKRRWRGDVVAGQGALMVACRCGRGMGRESFDVAVVAAADVSKLVGGSSVARLDVEALIAGWFASCSTASVGTERPLGFALFLGAMRQVSHAPGARGPS